MDIKFLNEIIKTPSPVGYEDNLMKLVVDYTKSKAEDFIYDNFGSVTAVYNKNSKFKVMLAAHADEISLIVTGYNSDGSLTVDRNGGVRTKLYIGCKVRVITKEGKVVLGVAGTNSSLGKKADVDAEDLFIDIGASNIEEAKKVVPLGSYVIHDTDMVELLDDKVSGRAFDDRLGVFITQCACLKAMEMGAKVGIYCTATTGEENTGRGAYSTSAIIKPDIGIVVDVTYANDYKGADTAGEVSIGKGGVICIGSLPNRKLNELLEKTAKEINEPIQYEVWAGRTATDGDTILRTNEGVPHVLFSIPLRYMHSPIEIASKKDIESMINVLAKFLCNLSEDVDLRPYKF
ncbi:MAG: M42 family metallopeptidase [Erysipelotrichaceae bacterium]|nr:M42 family metallopeptidase [Erysipelotrichaceae bacterium]